MKKLTLIVVLLGVLTAGVSAQNKREQVTIQTSGTGQHCKETIENNIAYEKGVKDVNYDLSNNKVTITFDARKNNVDNLRSSLNKLGFDADNQKTNVPKACGNNSQSQHRQASCCPNDGHKHGEQDKAGKDKNCCQSKGKTNEKKHKDGQKQ